MCMCEMMAERCSAHVYVHIDVYLYMYELLESGETFVLDDDEETVIHQ